MKNLLIAFITIAAIFVTAHNAHSQSTLGPNTIGAIATSPGTGTMAFTSTSNLTNSDGSYCQITSGFNSGMYSDSLILSDFGFSLPSAAIIIGIKVEMERRKKGRGSKIQDAVVQLIDVNSLPCGDNKADIGTNWGGKVTTIQYGSKTDLWADTTWTASDINSANFGVIIQIKSAKNDSKADIDQVRISVTYSLAGQPDGPAGVGSTNGSAGLVGWYKPELMRDNNNNTLTDGGNVYYWLDASGFGNNLSTNGWARFESDSASLVNGYPAFSVSGAGKKCYTTDNISAKTIIIVTKLGNGNQQLAGIDGVGINTAGTTTEWDYNNGNGWDGNVGEGHSYINGSIIDTGTHNNQLHIISQSRPTSLSGVFYLGGYSGGNKFTGDILEVLIFDVELSLGEKIIIDNYLSAKYFINLVANDLFTADDPIAGNFDYHVAGIGMATDSTGNDIAKGTGIITMSNASSMDPGDYLFWGENMDNSPYTFATAFDYMERLISGWRVSKSNDLGNVTVSADAYAFQLENMQSCASLRLMVSSDSMFLNKHYYELTLIDGQYVADSVDFSEGEYFTYEYQDIIAIDSTNTISFNDTSHIVSIADKCYKLLITSTADGREIIGTDCEFREIEIETGGIITIDTGIFMSIENDIINNGTITVQEGASLIQRSVGTNNNSGTGNYVIQRSGNTSAYIYNIWSSPINAADIPTVFNKANPCDIWIFDEANQAWSHDYAIGHTDSCYGNPVTFTATDVISGGDGIMDIARGYYVPGDVTPLKEYDGQVNNGDLTVAITTTALGNPGGTAWGADDWNLLGNPYPSGLNGSAFWTANAANISDALYFWDAADTTGGYNENTDYASWNNTGAVESGNSSKLPDGNIASGQGFWVVATNTTTLNFDNSMRSDTNSQFFKTSANHNQHNSWFSFTTPSGYINKILVGFNPATTDTLDSGYDAHKLVGNNHVKFTTLMNNEEFVIQSLAMLDKGSIKELGLAVYSAEAGIHTFGEYRRENMDIDLKIYLRDNVLGIDHDLSLGDYLVNLNANVEYRTRFELVFSNEINIASGAKGSKGNPWKSLTEENGTTTSIDEVVPSGFSFTQDQNEITLINHAQVAGTIRITDATGKVLMTQEMNTNQSHTSIHWSQLAQGSYFVTIHNYNELLYSQQVIKN